MTARQVRAGQANVELGVKDRLEAGLKLAEKKLRAFGQGAAKLGGLISAPFAVSATMFASFDDAIRATAAVSGATGRELQSLNDRARELGATTSFTAVQVANLMTELGRAGFKPDEIEEMTLAVLDLSRATGTDAALSAGIMAATLRQFGLGAKDATRAADVLTKAANSTFNTVEGLGESLKYAGPVAKSLGMSFEDTAAILGVLGNVGIQGSEAGTALRRLSVISAASGDELKRIFNIDNVDSATGQMKPLVQILDEINTVTANMPVHERTARMAEAFGLLGITSANVLSQTAGGVTELAEVLRGAEGTAAKTAKEMDAGLGGSIRIALSAVEGMALAVGDALAPRLQAVIGSLTEMAGVVTKIISNNQGFVAAIGFTGAALLAAGLASWGLSSAIAFMTPVFTALISVASALGGVLISAFAAVTSPIGLVIAGIVGIGIVAQNLFGVFDPVLNYLGNGFNWLRETFSTAWGGISDAIATGDLALAAQIGFAGLKLVVATAMESVIELFGGSIETMSAMLAELWKQIGSVLAQLNLARASVSQWIAERMGDVIGVQVMAEDNADLMAAQSWGQSFNQINTDQVAKDIAATLSPETYQQELNSLVEQARKAREEIQTEVAPEIAAPQMQAQTAAGGSMASAEKFNSVGSFAAASIAKMLPGAKSKDEKLVTNTANLLVEMKGLRGDIQNSPGVVFG
jgi:TP901 family phage tail tape measure protein